MSVGYTVLGLVAHLIGSALSSAAIPVTWVGEFKSDKPPAYFEVTLDGAQSTITVPDQDVWKLPLANVRLTHDSCSFVAMLRGDSAFFRGALRGGRARGTVHWNGSEGVFVARTVRRDVTAADAVQGNYTRAGNQSVTLGATDGGNLFYFLQPGRRVGRLERTSDSTWIGGPGLVQSFPVHIDVTLSTLRNETRKLVWREAGKTLVFRHDTSIRASQVRFNSGSARLSGELLQPREPGRHPAIVLLHGAGAESHRDFHWLRYYLAGHGFAVLSYDKRGVGGSTGDWRSASFEDLAADALAAVRLLRADSSIARDAIGVLGWSNGGWVAPLVAREPEVAFAVVGAAPGMSNGDNIAFEVSEDLSQAGFTSDELRSGVALRNQVTRFVVERPSVSAAAFDSLRTHVASARDARWFSRARVAWVLNVAPPPDTSTAALFRGLRAQWGLDPAPVWRDIHKPVLIMLGEMDNAVPALESATRLRNAFAAGANCNANVLLFQKGSHALFEVASRTQTDVRRSRRYVQGFPDSLIEWLQQFRRARQNSVSMERCRA